MARSARTGPSPRSPITSAKTHSADQKSSRFSTDQRQACCGSAPGITIASRNRLTSAEARRDSDGSHSNVPSVTMQQGYHTRAAAMLVAERSMADEAKGSGQLLLLEELPDLFGRAHGRVLEGRPAVTESGDQGQVELGTR